MIRKDKMVLLTFGTCGFVLLPDASEMNYTISGYNRPDNFFDDDNLRHDLEGCIVLDKRPAIDRNPVVSIRSPLCSPKVKDGKIDRCPKPSDLLSKGLGHQFKSMLNLQENHQQSCVSEQAGPLDSISVNDYVKWWKEKGAITGIIRSNKIIWED